MPAYKRKRPKCPKLATVVGELRPVCQHCNQPIKPSTCHVDVVGYLFSIPCAKELELLRQPEISYPDISEAINRGYQADRVFRLAHRTNYNGREYTQIHFWRGTYLGYGWPSPEGPPLFCTEHCAGHFAIACWRAGMRMKPKTPDPEKENVNA